MTSRECGFSGLGCGFVRRGAVVAVLFLALGFTAGAASGSDNAAFVSYTGVPTSMKPGEQTISAGCAGLPTRIRRAPTCSTSAGTATAKKWTTGTTTWATAGLKP